MAKIPREITVGIEVRGLEKMRNALNRVMTEACGTTILHRIGGSELYPLHDGEVIVPKYRICKQCGAELSYRDLKRCICSSCGADWGRVECPWCGHHWAENPGVCWDGVNGCGGPIPIGVRRMSPMLIDNYGVTVKAGDVAATETTGTLKPCGVNDVPFGILCEDETLVQNGVVYLK